MQSKKLYSAEQELLLDRDLPLRPWYKHVLYAPGLYAGYGVKTMTGIREAIEGRNYAQSEIEIKRVAIAIDNLSDYLYAL